jgi:hypothetical protein
MSYEINCANLQKSLSWTRVGGWVLIKSLRGTTGRLRRFPGISALLPSSSPYQYARTEGYFLHSEIAI